MNELIYNKKYNEEIELDLPPTEYFKDVDKIEILSKAETGFLKVFVIPLWENANKMLKNELI